MLLPYASDRPPKNPPLVVVSLVLFHFLLFGLLALILRVRGVDAVIVWYANLSLVPAAIKWYTPLSYAFLHEDVLHLSVNMLFLWVFGGSVEDVLRWKRFLALYLFGAVASGLLQAGMALLMPGAERTMPIVGASGAVATIVGVFAVRFYRTRIRFIGLPFRVPALLLIGIALIAEMGATIWHLVHRGESPGAQAAAHWAHIGGFVLGMAFAQVSRMFLQGRHEYLAADAAALMERSPLSAAQRWQTVLAVDPSNLYAQAELGRAWAAVGDRQQSVEHYHKAIAGYLEKGDKREAARRYRELTESYADEALEARYQLDVAGALEVAGEFREATRAYEAVVTHYPDIAEAERACLRLAVLYAKRLNETEKARVVIREFLKRYPHSEWRGYVEDLQRSLPA
jgi:membrane associated rhomboid family serine protease